MRGASAFPAATLLAGPRTTLTFECKSTYTSCSPALVSEGSWRRGMETHSLVYDLLTDHLLDDILETDYSQSASFSSRCL